MLKIEFALHLTYPILDAIDMLKHFMTWFVPAVISAASLAWVGILLGTAVLVACIYSHEALPGKASV